MSNPLKQSSGTNPGCAFATINWLHHDVACGGGGPFTTHSSMIFWSRAKNVCARKDILIVVGVGVNILGVVHNGVGGCRGGGHDLTRSVRGNIALQENRNWRSCERPTQERKTIAVGRGGLEAARLIRELPAMMSAIFSDILTPFPFVRIWI